MSSKLIAYYSIYNEAEFIHESLASVYDYVDRIIIIEGAWKETYEVNGHKRSTDGTINIVKKFIKLYDADDKIEYYEHNENSQLEQRNLLWNYIEEDCLILLVDGDEVWEGEQIKLLREATKDWPRSCALPPLVYTVQSLIFINDFFNCSKVRYPRLWEIEAGCQYNFVEPNRITVNGHDFDKKDLDVHYFHYSYCHSAERFEEKKRERTKLHGSFAWELREGIVSRDDAHIQPFDGRHPKVMKYHSLFGKKKHRQVKKPEVIVYVEHSGIGNLILSTPLLQALREAKPDAHIYVVSWNRAYRILEGAQYINSIIPVEDTKQLAQLANVSIDHLIISPVGSLGNVAVWLQARSKSTINIQVEAPWTKNEAEYKLSAAKKLGWRGKTPKCHVPILEYNLDNAREIIGGNLNVVGINASYLKTEHWHLKHWGNKKFKQLINNLQLGNDYTYVFLGAQDDWDNAEEILNSLIVPVKTINLCGFSSDIKDTAAIIHLCRILIGNDSGLQHIAAGVDTPTTTVFTFTNPIKNKPFGSRNEIAMVPCENRLSCQHGNWQRCKDNGCMDLSVDKVVEIVQKQLGGGNG